MVRCKGCRHWEADPDRVAGTCGRIEPDASLDAELRLEPNGALMTFDDSDPYTGAPALKTRPGFGCVLGAPFVTINLQRDP
jgi:hypothetical protein